MPVTIGCTALPKRVARVAYFGQLDYFECNLWFNGPVKAASWKRWVDDAAAVREERPDSGLLGVVAPMIITHPLARGVATKWQVAPEDRPLLGHFRASGSSTRALDWFVSQIEAPPVVVFPTPASFSPSATNREALHAFFAERGAAERFGGAVRVWQPAGLWDLQTALKTATEAGVVLAWDPMGDPTTPPDVYETLEAEQIYWRLSGLGRSGPLSAGHLDQLCALAEVRENSWFVFSSPDSWKDARRFSDAVGL
ncbi:MAG: hypothetical protein K8W52_30735 [Deltaproteobacteria bacterium]|nr:hypothetical protein [Deltaproteobacteria bacterium]